ncbi:nitroreductase family protein [Peptoniphilus duerdenii]|uniref:nitroreductase family protein n=1 Tax=Peptoniphilus duerdenii TaxID=507750 RepID=UPI00288C49A5|nr:nitroreductase family protein [Peptoniphilus duerdenii]
MLLTNFLEKRKSVRNFTDKSADSTTLDKVKSIIKNSEEENYILFENGKIIAKGLEGKAGYNNTMIVAPHYIGLSLKGSTDEDRLKTGYYLEKINTELIRLGLSTCWITVDNVDDATSKSVFGEEGAHISYLIAFGYPKARKLFDPKTQSERKPVSEIVFVEDFNHPATAEDLEQYGILNIMSTIRYAPNYMNLQPWRFLIKESAMELFMEEKYDKTKTLVDCGVIMYYFEELMKAMGRKSTWNIKLEEAEGMLKIATFTM